jgi:hypothetical protein
MADQGRGAAVHDGIDDTILLVCQRMVDAISGSALSKNAGQFESRFIQGRYRFFFFGLWPS